MERIARPPRLAIPKPAFPSFQSLIDAFARLTRRHPATTLIGARFGCYAENSGWVSALLDTCPNLCIDISARIAQLGRQPCTARRFFLRYADRILLGIDAGSDLATYGNCARLLEADDK